MFTTEHFIWIGICIVFIAALTYVSLHFRFSFRTSACVMAGIALASEISKILSHMNFVNGTDASKGMVLGAQFLPLHLCSLLIFAFFYLPFAKNERIKNYLLSLTVPVGLIGSLLAILMATSGTDFTEATSYQCFIYHAGMTFFALYLVKTKQVDLGRKAWLTNLASLFTMAIGMIWVNSALQMYDTNFWYVVRPPVKGLPLLNLDNGWLAYFATLLVLGFIGVTAIHLPALIGEAKQKRKAIG